MKEIRCPFCGRENTRGKYCMFCGNPLAGGRAAGTGGSTAGKQAEDQRWDPETAYIQRKGRTIAVLAAIIVLIACAGVVYSAQTRVPGRTQQAEQAFQAPLGTPGASSLREMISILKSAGMTPRGKAYSFGSMTYQQFSPFVILDEKTTFSMAEVREPEEIIVVHAFNEPEGKRYTISNRGPVFERLLEKLTEAYGEPSIRDAADYCCWLRGRAMLILYYGSNNAVRLEFHEEVQNASV